MRAHFLQHVRFEGPGYIERWLSSAGYAVTHSRLFKSDELPEIDTIDLLVAMGGPMSANQEDRFPWLVREKEFIREVIATDKPVLGICLGAQLIAKAMGAAVYRNREKEIGWHPIQGLPSSDESTFAFPAEATVFHWHGETFDLPRGARLLARSKACENQAFQFGNSVIGLQFHLETTPDAAQALVSHCADELIPSHYVQTAQEILSAPAERYRSINGLMGDILSFLTYC